MNTNKNRPGGFVGPALCLLAAVLLVIQGAWRAVESGSFRPSALGLAAIGIVVGLLALRRFKQCR